MKKIRKNFSPLIVAALCFVFVLVSCEQEETNLQSETVNFTGEALFRGVFFTDGKVGEQIDLLNESALSLNNRTQEEKGQFDVQMDKITSSIGQNHPEFFPAFEAAVQSKNHHAIKEVLLEGTEYLSEAMIAVFPAITELRNSIEQDVLTEDGKLDQEKLDAKLPEYEALLADNMISTGDQRLTTLAWNINVWINVNVSTNINVHVNVNIHTNVNVSVNINITDDNSERGGNPDSLYFEMLVDDLAKLELTR